MKFGFASMQEAGAHAREAAARFPAVLLSALVTAIVAMVMIEAGDDDPARIRMLATASLGLPLFTAIETTGERRAWSVRGRAGAIAAGVLALVLFWALSAGWSMTVLATRYVQLSVAFHLLAAFLPFAGFASNHAFWQYNRILFLRFLLAALYTVVLFAGLAVALVALDNLFGIDVDSEAYAHLWILLALVFHPWFFLGGLPRDIEGLERRTDYPLGLKVFAQFVLIPVVIVYVFILSTYLVRVLLTRTWPSGWIGWLVSSVAAAGTLALLLVHPVRDREDSRWVDAYGRWFFIVLLPSIGMLLAATWQRLAQYGFTERRYFLLVLALWLAGIAVYYAMTASRNIRLIPVTLCAVALATLAGPWSAYAVSRRSQASRLESLLVGQEMLVGGRIVAPASDTTPPLARREISAAVRYLVETHGPESLGLVSEELRLAAEAADTAGPRVAGVDSEIAHAVVANTLGIGYVTRWESAPEDWVNFYSAEYGRPLELEGFDVLVPIELSQVDSIAVPLGTDTLTLSYTAEPMTLFIRQADRVLVEIALWPLVDRVRSDPTQGSPLVPRDPRGGRVQPLELRGEQNGVRYRLLVHNLTASGRGEAARLNSSNADLLLSWETGR